MDMSALFDFASSMSRNSDTKGFDMINVSFSYHLKFFPLFDSNLVLGSMRINSLYR